MSDTPTAQSIFKDMLKRDIAPLLKEHGYRRARNRWGLLSKTGWQVIDFQCSQWSNKDGLQFTVNLGFLSKRVCELRKTPFSESDPPSESRCHYRERIGHFLPSKCDEWWELDVDSVDPVIARRRRRQTPEQIGAAVRDALETLALPYLAGFISDEHVLRTIETSKFGILIPWLDQAALVLEVRGKKAFEQYVQSVLDKPHNAVYRDEWLSELVKMGYQDRTKAPRRK